MLCQLTLGTSFPLTWIMLSCLTLLTVAGYSSVVFYYYYGRDIPYELWKRKINPKYPSVDTVKTEMYQTFIGIWSAALCPALTLYLTQHGWSKGQCDNYSLVEFFVVWILVDLYEFLYHYLGHTTKFGWNQHKSHHQFYNPTPFAVIADDFIDQFVRAIPLVLIPLVYPINMDVLFLQFAILFYGFGTYLHTGYDSSYLSPHNPIINTSYHHYIHHAKSIANKPYYTGFFFKIWDNLFQSVYSGPCQCTYCTEDTRTKEMYNKYIQDKPHYSKLFRW